MKAKDRKIVFEDGTAFSGCGFGSDCDRVCEIVFNTSMVGYQEMLSDPACTDKAVVMTYPLIGNYGVTDDDYESKNPSLGALIVCDYNDVPSNFRYTKTLSELMEENGIPGISGLDTRMLTRMIRNGSPRRVLITSIDTPIEEAVATIRRTPVPHDAVARVSCRKRWYARTSNPQFSVVAVDCGMKLNVVRSLNKAGCNVTVVPYSMTAEEIAFMKPDGIVIAGGPGTPDELPGVIATIRELKGRYPLFGISLGHELIARAYGASTYRLKNGHRGSNHPVMLGENGKVEIVAQNHGYAVDEKSLAGTGLEVTHRNLLDRSVEGLQCRKDNVFSVQFCPEGAPGSQDSSYLFDRFVQMMKEVRNHA